MITLETPPDPGRMPSFVNIPVADIKGFTPTRAQTGFGLPDVAPPKFAVMLAT